MPPALDSKEMLARLLKAGEAGQPAALIETQIRLLLAEAREHQLSEPTLLEIDGPVHIVGDIHGQFDDLCRHFAMIGWPHEETENEYKYLFLGDYVDRGKFSVETIALLLLYKVMFPKRIYLLRGNHESASINRIYGFYDECKRRFNIKLWKTFTDCFNCFPLAAVVQGMMFCVHGGLSPNFNNLDQIRKMTRPMDIPDNGLVSDLLWSDPDEDITGWGENDRGVSYTFGNDVVISFLERNNLELVVRAHQVVEDGYQFFARRKLVTLFSAPNYCGEFDNAGAILSMNKKCLCSFSILKPKSVVQLK